MNKITISNYGSDIAINIYGDEEYRTKQFYRFLNYGAVASSAKQSDVGSSDLEPKYMGPNCQYFLTSEESLRKALLSEAITYCRSTNKQKAFGYTRKEFNELLNAIVEAELASIERENFWH